MAQANNNAKVKAEAEARAKAEAEREVRREQARINAAAKAEVERLRKKNENEKKKSTMKPLTRNTLVRNLANLKEPALDPLRDAIMSLSDPSFLNKKFNEEVYRGLPLRVKDFIGLSANQVTRAVIISKIIEAVKIGRERNAKAKNVSDNMGLAKTLVKAVNGLNKSKPGVATTNRAWSIKQKTPVNATTGTTPKPNMKPVATVTTTPQGPPPPPPTPPPPIQPINKNASKKAQAKNAAEAAAKAAINRQIRLIENRLEKLNNPANLIAEFETLKTKRSINNLTSFSNKVESFQQGPEKAASGQPNRSNTPAVATMETQTNFNNAQAKLITNLQAKLEQAQQDVAQGKVNANAKVAQLTNELGQVKANLVRERNEAEKAVANIQKELQNASNAEKANLEKRLENAEAALNLKTKVIALTRVRAAVSKNKLRSELSKLQKNKDKLSKELQNKINQLAARKSSNEEIKQVAAERNAALKGLSNYSKTLANVMQNKKTNENTIEGLKTNLAELQGISNATRNQLSAQIKQLEQNRNAAQAQLKKMQNAEAVRKAAEEEATRKAAERKAAEEAAATVAAAAAASEKQTALNLFKAKVIKAKKTITNARLNKLLENANKPNPNLPNLERQFADIAEKPRIYLFLNKFDRTNLPNYAQLEGIQTFGAKSGNVTNAVENIEAIVSEYTSIEPKKNLNLFFIGPSGSGKTFLFDKYLGKNITGKNIKGMVTAYYPTFDYDLESGILTISDESKQMSYGQFQQRFIHPTPFNPNSSRAHMSYQNQNGDVTAFDLAGTENPIAIMYEALGYNIFETKYWEKFSSASVKDIVRRVGTKTEVNQLLSALGLKANTISGLNEMVFLYVFWNYIDRKVSVGEIIAQPILSVLASKRNEAKIKMMVEIFNDIKRVFEGFWITRSLHALNLLFTNNSYKKLVNKTNTNTNVTGTNIARSNVTGSKGAFEIELKRRVVKDGIARYVTSKFVDQLGSINRTQDTKFVILNKNNPSYETNFVAGLLESGNSNCLIGVVDAQSSFTKQRLAAIEYLESLQK